MAPEITPQSNDEDFYQIVAGDDGQTLESMDAFIKSLEQGFEYPELAKLGQTDEQIAAEILGNEGQETDEDETDDEGTSTSTPPAPVVSDTPPVEPDPTLLPDHVLINGNQIPLADVQRLYEFDQYLRSNPEAAERVHAAVQPVVPTPEQTPPPANQELTPPEWMDLEDPQQKFMWDSHVSNQRLLATMVEQNNARAQSEINARAQSDMASALTRWTAAHPNFNEDQIEKVRKHGAEMNIISGVMATSPDPVTALVRVMDLAAMDDPDLRAVYLTPEVKTPTRQQRSTTRKGKLNSLGGSSGSVPRTTTTPRPMSDREAIDQFAAGLAESFQQN
jgi:hypothetical protein